MFNDDPLGVGTRRSQREVKSIEKCVEAKGEEGEEREEENRRNASETGPDGQAPILRLMGPEQRVGGGGVANSLGRPKLAHIQRENRASAIVPAIFVVTILREVDGQRNDYQLVVGSGFRRRGEGRRSPAQIE